MSFLNLRIRGRLYGGFGALVLFCAGLAGFAIWQLMALHDQIAVLSLQSSNTVRVGEITTNLQAIRRGILRYVFDQDEASLADADKRLDQVMVLLDDAVKTTKSDERKSEYREVMKNVAELKIKRTAIAEAIKQMQAGRSLLFTDGDKMAADVQKFVDAAAGTAFVEAANALESRVLLVRVANWRMLATREAKGIETFKTNVGKAQQEIVQIEKADLPPNLAKLLDPVKTGIAKYADAFAKTGPNLVQADELYYKAITPSIVSATQAMDKVKAAINEAFTTTDAETNDRITTTISAQEVVAGGVILIGLLIAYLIARGIAVPLGGLTSGMKQLAGGNFGVVLPGLGRKDEIGDIAGAVEQFKVVAEQKAREEGETKIRQDQIAARQRKDEMQRLADGFEAAVGEIVQTVSSASARRET